MTGFDVVVAGGGAAGWCCAASLAERGHRVALVPERESFEWSLREDIPPARAFMDELFHHYDWAGGAWLPLMRRLDISVDYQLEKTFELFLDDPAGLMYFQQPQSVGPRALKDYWIGGFAAIGADLAGLEKQYHEVLTQLLSIDPADYPTYSTVHVDEWLDGLDAELILRFHLNAYCANLLFLPHDMCAEHLSVAAAAASLRAKHWGGGVRISILENARDALFRQLAAYIESKGGHVERKTYLSEVLVERDRARGVVLTNTETLTAPVVAAAVPGARLGRYFGELPEPVRAASDYQTQLTLTDLYVASRLDEPTVCIPGAMSYVSNMEAACEQVIHPIRHLATRDRSDRRMGGPAGVGSGEVLLVTQRYRSAADSPADIAGVNEMTEHILPGFAKATVDQHSWEEQRYSLAAQAYGPKVPRTVADIAGLWFVGEGSELGPGLVGCEAGAASGIAGAESVLKELS